MGKRERKVHKQDPAAPVDKVHAKCGAKQPRTTNNWSEVTCGTCRSWLPLPERSASASNP